MDVRTTDPAADPMLEQAGDLGSIDWLVSRGPVPYPFAVAWMEARVDAIRRGNAAEAVWFLEHPPLYTAGTSADPDELLDTDRFPVYRTGRGGRYTYHGPGQRVAYVMLDLKPRGQDVRRFVCALETALINTLAAFGVRGERRAGRIGIWVGDAAGREAKIAAVGVRVRRWVTYHGIALNVCPNLDHFAGIVPCGIAEFGVTSLAALNVDASLSDVDAALFKALETTFGQRTSDF